MAAQIHAFTISSSVTYQQNKENKEHISDKVDWPKDSVSIVDGIKIKVSKNNSELCEAAGGNHKEPINSLQ